MLLRYSIFLVRYSNPLPSPAAQDDKCVRGKQLKIRRDIKETPNQFRHSLFLVRYSLFESVPSPAAQDDKRMRGKQPKIRRDINETPNQLRHSLFLVDYSLFLTRSLYPNNHSVHIHF